MTEQNSLDNLETETQEAVTEAADGAQETAAETAAAEAQEAEKATADENGAAEATDAAQDEAGNSEAAETAEYATDGAEVTEAAEETGAVETSEAAEETEAAEANEAADGDAEETAEETAAPAFNADEYLEQLSAARRSVTAGIVIYKGRINEKLQERTAEGYDAVASIVNEPQYDQIAQYDQELTAFKSTGSIYRMEAGNEQTTIYDLIEYIEDYRMIYEQMMFFLRRMQFGLDYSDCMVWLREWGLTVHFVLELLWESELGEKGRVARILAGMYDAAGRRKEAIYLLSVMKEHCREEEKEQLDAMLEKLRGPETLG